MDTECKTVGRYADSGTQELEHGADSSISSERSGNTVSAEGVQLRTHSVNQRAILGVGTDCLSNLNAFNVAGLG